MVGHTRAIGRGGRGEWKRRRVAHAEEFDDVEERLEAEVARNHRLQEALVVATVNSK